MGIVTEPYTGLLPERFHQVRNENKQMDDSPFSYGATPLGTFDVTDSAESIQSYFTYRGVNNRCVSISCTAPSILLFRLISNESGDMLLGMEGFYVLGNSHYLKGPFLSPHINAITQADDHAI